MGAPPQTTLFPYTTLFRSGGGRARRLAVASVARPGQRLRRDAGTGPRVRSLREDRKSTRLNSSHRCISYAVICLKKKINSLMYIDPSLKNSVQERISASLR